MVMIGAGAVLLALLAAAPVPSPPPDDAKEPRPPVEVQVRSEEHELTEGATATYTIMVRNRSGQDLPHTVVTQVMPGPLSPISSDPQGVTKGRQISWRVPLPAGEARTLSMTGRISSLGEGARARLVQAAHPAGTGDAAAKPARPRLATTVCVRARDRGQLLTCSTASSQLSEVFWPVNRASAAISAVAAFVVGAAGVVLLRRRRAAVSP